MDYYIDLKTIDLKKFKKSLAETSLLPSQKILKEKLDERFQILEKFPIKNLSDLQQVLKSKEKVKDFAEKSGLPEDYLTILRREVNSYHPKPIYIRDFPGIDQKVLQKIEKLGIKHTLHIFPKIKTAQARNEFIKQSGISESELIELTKLTDLSRIKWVGTSFARLLYRSGYDTVAKVAGAGFQELYQSVIKTNKTKNYYKGKFGLNDIELLVLVANDVPLSIQY